MAVEAVGKSALGHLEQYVAEAGGDRLVGDGLGRAAFAATNLPDKPAFTMQ
jgi:hypothetical protein